MCEWIFAGVFSTGRTQAPKRDWCFPAGRYVRRRGSGGSPPGALSAPKGEWPYTEATPSGAAPTSPPEGVFRHKRRMELVELSGRITGRLGYTCRLEPTPSEGRQRWHYDTLSSPHLPPPALVLKDDCGPPGAVGGWAPPPLPPGPQDLPRDYGPDGAAGGLKPEYTAASGPRTFGSGPTTGTRSQTTCYVRRGTGRVIIIDLIFSRFFLTIGQPIAVSGHRLNRQLERQIPDNLALRFESVIKGTVA